MINTRKQNVYLIFCASFLFSFSCLHAEIRVSDGSVAPQQEIDLTLPVPEQKKKQGRRHAHAQRKKMQPEPVKQRVASFRHLSFQELEEVKNKLVAAGTWETAVKYLEQMIKICTDVHTIGQLLLEIGDLLYDNNQYKKAALIYTEFTSLYPGHEKIEYALYRAIVSSFHCCLSYDRDQTKTEETIELADAFLHNSHFQTHAQEVSSIRSSCYHTLAESEFAIYLFYVRRSNIKAATKRLAAIREKWLSKVPEIHLKLLSYEIELALLAGDEQTVIAKYTEQKELFPDVLMVAQNKKSMVDRF